jgi:hypothetical protein
MTESQWDACADPTPMLTFLCGKGSDRKLRLFACACCRASGHVFTDARFRHAVEVGERFADGRAAPEDLRAAWQGANDAAGDSVTAGTHRVGMNAAIAAKVLTRSSAGGGAALLVCRAAAVAAARALPTEDLAARQAEMEARLAASACLLRDLIGNPFRPVSLDPSWLAWNGGVVRKMAQTIYDEHRFTDLPVLADALEDAGCADAAAPAHCRQPGEHVRGCWVMDLLLGKA